MMYINGRLIGTCVAALTVGGPVVCCITWFCFTNGNIVQCKLLLEQRMNVLGSYKRLNVNITIIATTILAFVISVLWFLPARR